MRIVFRADASIQIGTGHIMRCLTLAEALRGKGADCHFICREHAGHLIEVIKKKGFGLHVLPEVVPETETSSQRLAHAQWLGASQEQDVAACMNVLVDLRPDWLVVDHYALDARWERRLRNYCGKLMVIDDLADREHQSDLLLDQTFGRVADDYGELLPPNTRVLCGSGYAMLRPEFAVLRQRSLHRREHSGLRRLLINLGGVDKDNVTTRLLEYLRSCELPEGCRLTVVMGGTAPFLDDVRRVAQSMPWPTEVLVGVTNMAELMTESDLAIGAAGATSWERCCLGLPTILLVLADNQKQVALALQEAGAAEVVSVDSSLDHGLKEAVRRIMTTPGLLTAMARTAADIVDGHGILKVIEQLE